MITTIFSLFHFIMLYTCWTSNENSIVLVFIFTPWACHPGPTLYILYFKLSNEKKSHLNLSHNWHQIQANMWSFKAVILHKFRKQSRTYIHNSCLYLLTIKRINSAVYLRCKSTLISSKLTNMNFKTIAWQKYAVALNYS